MLKNRQKPEGHILWQWTLDRLYFRIDVRNKGKWKLNQYLQEWKRQEFQLDIISKNIFYSSWLLCERACDWFSWLEQSPSSLPLPGPARPHLTQGLGIRLAPRTWFSQDFIILNSQVGTCRHYINLFALALYIVSLNFFACNLHGTESFTIHI